MCFVLIRCETVPSRLSAPSDHLLCSIVVTELVEVTRRVPTP